MQMFKKKSKIMIKMCRLILRDSRSRLSKTFYYILIWWLHHMTFKSLNNFFKPHEPCLFFRLDDLTHFSIFLCIIHTLICHWPSDHHATPEDAKDPKTLGGSYSHKQGNYESGSQEPQLLTWSPLQTPAFSARPLRKDHAVSVGSGLDT